jgi:hypothetical protein
MNSKKQTVSKKALVEMILKKLSEISATGTGSKFIPGQGPQTATPVAGKAKNYYVKKLGFKLVDRKKAKKSKVVDYKQLWK